MLIKTYIIRQIADALFHFQRLSCRIKSANVNLSSCWFAQSKQHKNRRLLSSTVRTEQTENFSFFDGQAQQIDSGLIIIHLYQILQLNNRIIHALSPPVLFENVVQPADYS